MPVVDTGLARVLREQGVVRGQRSAWHLHILQGAFSEGTASVGWLGEHTFTVNGLVSGIQSPVLCRGRHPCCGWPSSLGSLCLSSTFQPDPDQARVCRASGRGCRLRRHPARFLQPFSFV